MSGDSSFPRLRCSSGHIVVLANELKGCPVCLANGSVTPLEVEYERGAVAAAWGAMQSESARGSKTYERHGALPFGAGAVSLGEGGTPLLPVKSLGAALGSSDVFLKLEGYGPTGSYKDRMNAVAVSMARRFQAPGIVCSSTGNQGVAMAAYAGAAGIPAVVLFPEEVPEYAARQAALHGATVLVTPWDVRPQVTDQLLDQCGWSLSNRNDPLPWANPFGLEGYRAIAFEIVADLRRVPEAILMPTCGGDGIFGIWKGFRELRDDGVVDTVPAMIAVQPEVSNSLVQAFNGGAPTVSPVPLKYSIALSLTDRKTSDLALRAVRESDGAALEVTEAEIEDALVAIANIGIFVEPASAAAVAALPAAASKGYTDVVCVLTASGIRWPRGLQRGTYRRVDTLEQAISEVSRATVVTG